MKAWQKNILDGMEKIIQGCDNSGIDGCHYCPFQKYCELILSDNVSMPENWKIDEVWYE